jgi:hypothetical protein
LIGLLRRELTKEYLHKRAEKLSGICSPLLKNCAMMVLLRFVKIQLRLFAI